MSLLSPPETPPQRSSAVQPVRRTLHLLPRDGLLLGVATTTTMPLASGTYCLFSFSAFPRQPYLAPAGAWSASPFPSSQLHGLTTISGGVTDDTVAIQKTGRSPTRSSTSTAAPTSSPTNKAPKGIDENRGCDGDSDKDGQGTIASGQVCNSFKDPGPLMYGKESPLFIKCRDRLDEAFDALPAPTGTV